ncbi:galactosylceramide sulfotransferase-like [Penaeus indicus]|uniref:galactosylceramide sulfotransferase-like n=1 Tax=Penaeus indicus TaxID=29960 RepID=UPI00300C5BFE
MDICNHCAEDTVVTQSMSSPRPARKLETPARSCVPQNSVYFLKTAKCASTTFSQIFTAYGLKHALAFALPIRYGLLPISPKVLSPEYHGAPDGRYHMVVSHTQFNKKGTEQVMKESAKYVATIREPASRFESMWYFGNYEKVKGEVLSKAKWLNDSFDLVMVAERFDESLVLLKHLMCWNTEDVAYAKAKVRRPTYRAELSEAQKNRLRQLNRQDTILYKFFREIFEEKVKAFGEERMQREVEELRQANARLIDDCGAELTGTRGTVKMWKVTDNSNICKMLSMDGVNVQN